MLLLGGVNGNIVMTVGRYLQSDTNSDSSAINQDDNKQEISGAFRGAVLGLAHILDPKIKNRQFLIALGEDFSPSSNDEKLVPIVAVKVYNLADLNRPIQSFYGGFGDLGSINSAIKVTSFAVSIDGNQISIGYSNGAVSLFTGTFLKDGSAKVNPPTFLLREHAFPVSGLYFLDVSSSKTLPNEVQVSFNDFNLKINYHFAIYFR